MISRPAKSFLKTNEYDANYNAHVQQIYWFLSS